MMPNSSNNWGILFFLMNQTSRWRCCCLNAKVVKWKKKKTRRDNKICQSIMRPQVSQWGIVLVLEECCYSFLGFQQSDFWGKYTPLCTVTKLDSNQVWRLGLSVRCLGDSGSAHGGPAFWARLYSFFLSRWYLAKKYNLPLFTVVVWVCLCCMPLHCMHVHAQTLNKFCKPF